MSHLNYRVVAVTPAGRKRYLEILLPYLFRARDILDEYHLWINTLQPNDIQYCLDLARKYPNFIRLVWSPARPRGNSTIGYFYSRCVRPQTIYIKIDDDICYLEGVAIGALLDFRLAHPEYFLVYPNIINTTFCSYLHQQMGLLDTSLGSFTYEAFSEASWGNGQASAGIHAAFFKHLDCGVLDRFKFEIWPLRAHERNSINCVAWFGEDFASFKGGVKSEDDEQWLSVVQPKAMGRINAICGRSVMVHFAYYPQRKYLETETGLLERYRELSREACGQL